MSPPSMAQGVDPIAASRVQVANVAFALAIVYEFSSRGVQRDHSVWIAEVIPKTLGSGVIGMGVGMTFVMFASQRGKAGIVSTLSSTALVLILPVLWVISARRSVFGAWVGASIVFFGIALTFTEG